MGLARQLKGWKLLFWKPGDLGSTTVTPIQVEKEKWFHKVRLWFLHTHHGVPTHMIHDVPPHNKILKLVMIAEAYNSSSLKIQADIMSSRSDYRLKPCLKNKQTIKVKKKVVSSMFTVHHQEL